MMNSRYFEKTDSALALARLTSLAPPHLTLLSLLLLPSAQFLGPLRNKGFGIRGALDSQWAACKLCDLGPVARISEPKFPCTAEGAVNMVFII